MYVFVQELNSGPVANEILFTSKHCHGQGAGGSCGEDSMMGVRTDRLGKIKYVLLVGVSY